MDDDVITVKCLRAKTFMFTFEKLKLDWSRIFPGPTHFLFFLEQFFVVTSEDSKKLY